MSPPGAWVIDGPGSRSIGSSTFYLGRPLTGGMMIPIRPTLEHQPIKEFIMVLGGPLASTLGLAFGLAGFSLGIQSAVLYAWIYVSAIYVLLSSIPYTFTSKSLRLINDASRLIHILIEVESIALPVGPALASTQALAELLTAIKCDTGLSYIHSSIASLQAVLGDLVSARQVSPSQHRDRIVANFVFCSCSDRSRRRFERCGASIQCGPRTMPRRRDSRIRHRLCARTMATRSRLRRCAT